jgi:hypothetical protein
MGIGFVLLFWMMFFGCAGLPIAAGLGYWSWRNSRGRSASKERAVAAGCLPFVLIPVGLLWFFSYAAYSGIVRKMDPGLGDTWTVPLPHGYFFCMIDVTDHGYLMKDGCSGSPPVDGIRELAQVGDSIIGSSGRSDAFVFDTSTGKLTLHRSISDALRQFSPVPQLQTADQFYRSRRFGWQDVVAALILCGLVLLISWLWFRRYIRAPSPAAIVAEA